jgi:two-component system phosphate regulon sensor histidine kinase PhoR
MSSIWLQEFWRLFILILSMSFIGFLIGQTLLFLLITTLGYITWNLYNLYRLENWFLNNNKLPESTGIWGEIYYQIYRRQQRHRKRKRRISTILKRFQRSTAAMPDAAVVLDHKFQIEWFNKAAKQLLGLKLPQDRDKLITNLIRNPAFAKYLKTYDDYEKGIKIFAPTNHQIMLNITVIPYAGNQYLLIAHDISQLHSLEQSRRDFVANISHELRTPLTVIQGFIETMRDNDDSALQQWQRPLLLMDQQSARMRNIIDDLLFLSRLECESVKKNNHQPIKIADIIRSIYEEAQLLTEEHNISLEVDENLILNGHAKELRSAFSNLVFNAIRYTPAGGEIKIRWYQDTEGKHFAVHDTGEGIAPEHLPRITERFYRVDIGRSRDKGGTGLGLAIVKHVLNHHQGKLRIESIVGEGSVFYCDFGW